ncbi:DEAD/DEAH box helicase [Paenibacillus nanensis]|uniref:ATP-dependent RNA helicase CshA n=1 Tax=Paenibacillus nanensis TaxID=393251 RepID=A0A3A1UQB2_9BACL|nr:DEAD/DEAH box helicase [Paenibacillus nanensis]RIX48726.1 DEAD/DEAH box helicase [Paenibacillus nanensis]
MNFKDLQLKPEILKALAQENYESPTPIQERSIPSVLAGRDLLGCAQTGTGKTAAFSLPIIQLLSGQAAPRGKNRPIRALILSPTRELALQISDNIVAYSRYTDLSCLAIVGGVSQQGQERALAQGTDILIATPGRLMDLMNQKVIGLQAVEILVLDEADRMLDMGFINDVKKIIAKLPGKKQTLFFSATMPPEIEQLAGSLLTDPVKVEVTPVSSTVDRISQSVYFVDKPNKQMLLNDLLQDRSIGSALVFTRTKHGADRVARGLNRIGVTAQAIHGDKSQNSRQNALSNFKSGATRVLVATDIAARGIDVEDLSHVINFNLPNIPETYVHRIGRTGRAGNSGVAISFCEAEELPYLKDIEKLIKKKVPVVEEHPYPMTEGVAPAAAGVQTQKQQNDRKPKRQGGQAQPQKAQGQPKEGQSQQKQKQSQTQERQTPKQNQAQQPGQPKAEQTQNRPAGEAKRHPKQRNAGHSEKQALAGQQGQAQKQRSAQPASQRPENAAKSRKPQTQRLQSRQEIHQESGKVISVLSAPWSSFKPRGR